MIEGHIEFVSADGVVQGWVREAGQRAPCHVQILHAGQVVASGIADAFRPDLLAAGHGHGHYGFAACLTRPLPAGPCTLALHLPANGLSAPGGLVVPALSLKPPATVEQLLSLPPGWTVADLLAAPMCLDMPGNHLAMGSDRFVDAVFRFTLGRWPSAAEAAHHAGSLLAGRITPTGLLVELLTGRERADLDPGLPSPFDPIFPFASV